MAENQLVEIFAVNEGINQKLLASIPAAAWGAPTLTGKGRNIAEIFAHMHNVRLMWVEAAAKGSQKPDKLDKDCTPEQAAAALAASADCCRALIRQAEQTADGKIKNFRPNVAHFVAYLISHDAHHRGQICLLARQAGHAVDKKTGFGMWEWGTLYKDAGFSGA